MKSNSARRLPRFAPLAVSGPVIQKDPLTWDVRTMGFPSWFKQTAFDGKVTKPFYSTAALAEYARSGTKHDTCPPACFAVGEYEIIEVKARANPWHPNGRLDKLVLRKPCFESADKTERGYRVLTLKFHGPDEQIECVSARIEREFTRTAAKVQNFADLACDYMNAKYKGPRAPGDTKSAVSSNTRKR